ncbi:DUF2062 domain-containing protein [Citrifermentans bremense]|uniref:DUF2062 domain-containing protein n=1 Tax=Citrifermentans bremense TaxID=60035 RepID=UPI00040F3432|nr:DUF2062 domain-containing protein [Citrifermentans bremense]
MFNKELWKKRIYSILSLDSHPGHIAAGFAVGVFISFTPFFGLHTPLAIAAAFIFRLNKLTCVTGAWVNTPITIVPILGVSYKLGAFLTGARSTEFKISGLEWHNLERYAKSLILGSSLIGFICAVIAYFLCYYLVLRFRSKDAAQVEIAKEMAEVGEELD